jgi:two-component system response regulator YesN
MPNRNKTPAADKEELTTLMRYVVDEKDRLRRLAVSDARSVPREMGRALFYLSGIFPQGDQRLNQVAYRLYRAADQAIFEQFPWLRLYTTESVARSEEAACMQKGWQAFLEERMSLVKALTPEGLQGVLGNICAYILENPEQDIGLRALSEKFFFNRTYLSDLFHQKTGLRFNEYLTRVKMYRACNLLTSSEIKIGEISGRLGYNDIGYFNKLFKRFSGQTPRAYRKNKDRRF